MEREQYHTAIARPFNPVGSRGSGDAAVDSLTVRWTVVGSTGLYP